MLKSVKMPLNEITAAISLGDVNKLSKDFLHDILKYIPTKEEVEMMKQNESEIENFAEPDRLLWELSKISYCRDKINAMILCKGFSESCNYIEDASKIVAQACEEIKNSSKLKEVLRIALALGNYLNSQSKDAVYGFKISSILKLSEVRALGSGRKTTLLHYFSELLNEQFPAIADFPNDMPHVPEAATVQFPQVTSVIETLKEGSAKTRQLIINLSSEVPSCASASETESVENENVLKTEDDSEFVKRISAFQAIAESHVITLESCFEAARRALRSISTYYAEDPNISPKEFFGVFASFFNMYRNAMADVLLSQEIEKKKNDRTKVRHPRDLPISLPKLLTSPSIDSVLEKRSNRWIGQVERRSQFEGQRQGISFVCRSEQRG